MAYGQPPPLPPWATPAPDPSALPANDIGADPFLAWLHGAERAQPILQPPPESPVPDVAWSGPPPIAPIDTPTEALFADKLARIRAAGPASVQDFIHSPGIQALGGADAVDAAKVRDAQAGAVPVPPWATLGRGDGEVTRAAEDYDHYPDPVGDQPLADQIAGVPVVPSDGHLPMPPDAVAPFDPPVASDGDKLTEGALVETGPDTAAGWNDNVDRLTRDPIALADAQTNLALRRENERNLAMAKAAEEQRVALEDAATRREQARAAAQRDLVDINNRARELSDASPFETWWSDRSAGQKFANIIAGVFGGLVAPSGGRNSAIDMMMQVADADANAKIKKIELRRGLAQDALANADADYKESAAIRLAGYQQVLRTIDAKAANLDPQGTAAVALASARAEVIARIESARAAAGQQSFENADKIIKSQQEDRKIADAAAKAEADRLAEIERNRTARYGVAVQAKAQAETARHNRREEEIAWANALKETGQGVPADRLERDTAEKFQARAGGFRQVPVTVKNADGTTSTTFRTEPLMQAPAPMVDMFRVAPDGTPLPLVGADGKPAVGVQPWVIPTEKEAQAFRSAGSATDQMLQNLDEMIRLTQENGWEADATRSPAWQKQKVLKMRQLIAAKNAAGLGVLSESDIPIAMWNGAGTDDPTQFRDPLPGMLKARELIIRDRNLDARNLGYTGDPIDYGAAPASGDNALSGSAALVKKAGDFQPDQVRDNGAWGRMADMRGGARPILPPNTGDAVSALILRAAPDAQGISPNERAAAIAGLAELTSRPAIGDAVLLKIALESDLTFPTDNGDGALLQQRIDALRSLPPAITRQLLLNQAVEGGAGLSTAATRAVTGAK